MQSFFNKKTLIGGVMVFGLCLAQQGLAHDQAGSFKAAFGSGATDYYQVTCSSLGATATHHLSFQIKDLIAGGNMVGMTVIKADAPTDGAAVTTLDAIGGTATAAADAYSPAAQIDGGNGVYNVVVWHTGGAVTDSYTFAFHCLNGATHTTTAISRKSNQ